MRRIGIDVTHGAEIKLNVRWLDQNVRMDRMVSDREEKRFVERHSSHEGNKARQ